MKRAIFLIIFILFFILIMIISFNDMPPDVKVLVNIDNVSQKQYNNIKRNFQYTKENLKKLYINVNIRDNFFIYKTTIDIPETIELYKDSNNKVIEGGGYTNRKVSFNKTEIERYIIYDSSNLSKTDLRNILKSYKINITWKTLTNKNREKQLSIGEFLE
ncbi:hypothetical protein [Paramaledivibacter caminithermalis]|jgi:hypothetical protein|uniref:DUF4825 domain-containing protein n=1 Tax=Paramaledivibacter caminithermalis (strain DSM 15212 / CIP 107654 / DViRD3) TaxID=1121301 RepID=A0A1M6NZZ0_PARC5|nr:hypothetical protein [Paramaledivibacter caminithermalis]SHK01224.1 hypothetical protein SAMN02745912_01958 [Paramaledivibacter caminithermalis DSM 15212]